MKFNMKNKVIFVGIMFVFYSVSTFAQIQMPKLKPLKEEEQAQEIRPLEKKDGEWGYVNDKGKFLVKAVFSEARPYDKGVAIVRYGNKYGILDKTGVFLVQPTYDEMQDFRGNFSIVRKDGLYGTIARDGSVLTEPQFSHYEFRKDFKAILVQKLGLWGAVDGKGQLSVAPIYTDVKPVKDGVAVVSLYAKRGLVKENMQQLVAPEYDSLQYAVSGQFIAKKNGKFGVISYDGTEKFSFEHDDIILSNSGRYYIIQDKGKYGLLNPFTNKLMIKPLLENQPENLTAKNTIIKQDSTLILASEKGASWWPLNLNLSFSDLEGLAVPNDTCLKRYNLGTEMLLIHDGVNPYFISKDNKIIWAANSAIQSWAEKPINYSMRCETVVKKGYMTAVTEDNKNVLIEHSFELSWPVASIDPRVDVSICQSTLLEEMSKRLFGNIETSFNTLEEFLVYATTHTISSQHLRNVKIASGNIKNMNRGYSMLYKGEFVGDISTEDLTYDFHPYINFYDYSASIDNPGFIHLNVKSGGIYTLKDRYSLSLQSKMVKQIKLGSVVMENPDLKEVFMSVKNECDDLNDNFYTKDGIVYFYQRPLRSCPPMYVGLRQEPDISSTSSGKQTQSELSNSEYMFTSFDLQFFGLQNHVKSVVIEREDVVGKIILEFNVNGSLVYINGTDPFDEDSDVWSIFKLRRDNKGKICSLKNNAELGEKHINIEYDAQSNWTKRKYKNNDSSDMIESRSIMYY